MIFSNCRHGVRCQWCDAARLVIHGCWSKLLVCILPGQSVCNESLAGHLVCDKGLTRQIICNKSLRTCCRACGLRGRGRGIRIISSRRHSGRGTSRRCLTRSARDGGRCFDNRLAENRSHHHGDDRQDKFLYFHFRLFGWLNDSENFETSATYFQSQSAKSSLTAFSTASRVSPVRF